MIGVALIAVAIGVAVFISDKGNLQSTSSFVADNQSSAVIVPFTKLVQGTQSTIEKRVNYFITSTTQLSELWKMIDAAGTPPKVDFKKDAVIAVFAGRQPTTGYAIEVSKVLDSSSRMVSITLAKPDGACAPTQSSSSPYEIVAVPVTSLPLAHQDIVTSVNCPK